MISRVCGVSLAFLAWLTVVPVCFAQEPVLPPAPPPDTTAAAAPAPAAAAVAKPPSVALTRRASFGGYVGWGNFFADGDYSSRRNADGSYGDHDTRSRPSFAATFRYQVNSWLRWQIGPGYTWVGYEPESRLAFTDINFPADTTKEHVLTQLLPITAQVQYTMLRSSGWSYHAGAGGGVYKVWVQNRRKVLADPVSLERHSGWYPGVTGELGAERFLKSLTSVSIEGALEGHWVFAEGREKFPSGFNTYIFSLGLRVGASYHFDPLRLGGAKQTTAPVPPTGH